MGYEYMLDFESQVVLFTFVRPDELHNYTRVEAMKLKLAMGLSEFGSGLFAYQLIFQECIHIHLSIPLVIMLSETISN